MQQLLRDALITLRSLWRSRGLSCAALLCMTVGIGANTAIFSIVDAAVLRPLPFRDSDRLVAIAEVRQAPGAAGSEGAGAGPRGICAATLQALSGSGILAQVAGYDDFSANLAGQGRPERISAGIATPELFAVLGTRPLAGRTFTRDETRVPDARVVVLGHRLFARRFGGNPGAIGRSVRLDHNSYLVVGVMPAGFELPLGAELWEPLSLAFPDPAMRFWRSLNALGRLAPGKSLRQTQAQLELLERRLARLYPDAYGGWRLTARPLREELVGETRPLAFALMAAAGFVLAITSANLASLLLARGMAESRSLAIRSALGAGRSRLMRQPLLESLLLTGIGGGCGLAAGTALIRPLARLFPFALPSFLPLSLDARVLAFGLAAAVASGVLAGLAPALRAQRPDLQTVLKSGGRGATAQSDSRLQRLLVISEIAGALVLLVATGLLLLSVRATLAESPGFRTAGILTLRLGLPESIYPGERQSEFFERLAGQLRGLPGARAVGFTSALPLRDREHAMSDQLNVEGQPAVPGAAEVVSLRLISPGYLEAMGIQLLAGRDFDSHDDGKAPGVALVTQALARRYWPGRHPLGRRIRGGPYDSRAPWLTVVGVVADVKDGSLRGKAGPMWYQPFAQAPFSFATLVIRTDGDPLALAPAVRAAVSALDPEQPVYRVATMAEVWRGANSVGRSTAVLLGLFTLLGLALAALGVHGLISYMVSHRRHEIGVRMAMGAGPRDILGQVLRRGAALAALGLALGLASAAATARLLAGLVYGIGPLDPRVLAGACLFLFAVTLAASYLPARQASHIDPAIAFRDS